MATEATPSQRVDNYIRGRVVALIEERSKIDSELVRIEADVPPDSRYPFTHELPLMHHREELEKRRPEIDEEIEVLDFINQFLRGKLPYVVPD